MAPTRRPPLPTTEQIHTRTHAYSVVHAKRYQSVK